MGIAMWMTREEAETAKRRVVARILVFIIHSTVLMFIPIACLSA
jgi:hypothetical protein